ncbi:MAG: methyl-accepting chemotaxis protein [Cellvibrionaceae bacterium]
MSFGNDDNRQTFVGKFNDLPIAKKLAFGFGVVLTLMVVIVVVNFYAANRIATVENHLSEILVPFVESELELKSDVNESLAALRGYMILGGDKFKNQREFVWKDIGEKVAILDGKMQYFDETTNADFNEIKSLLTDFEMAQNKVETTAHTKDELPATKILLEDAAPRASKVLQAVTAIINEEKLLAATPERKELLGLLADSRGSFAVGLAAIRAYLLSGDVSWQEEFNKRWAVNEARFLSLQQKSYLFNTKQQASFSTYSQYRQEFSPLPAKMFSIRESDQWNMANYYLDKEVAPRADRLLTLLKGLAKHGHQLVLDDEAWLDNARFWMEVVSVALAVVALSIGIFCAWFITKQLTNSINTINRSINHVANGELGNMEVVSSKDEIGQLSTTLQQMQSRLREIIERDVQSMINNAREGDLSNRIDVSDKVGCYRELCEGINELMVINSQVVDDTVSVFSALAHGNLNTTIDSDYKGDFARIKKDANFTVEKLKQTIQTDVQALIDSAAKGDLNRRISMDDKEGFFQDLCEKINQLVEGNKKVVDDVVRVFAAMSQGDLSETITSDYNGEFLKLKEDTNATVAKLQSVIEKDIQNVVNAVLQGDLTQRIALDDKQGFFKRLSESINNIADVSETIISDASSVVGAMSEGNLTQTIEKDYSGSFGELKNNINATVTHLHGVIGEIQDASDTVKTASSEIALGVHDLSERTEQQAASLEETAASMEHMMDSVEKSSNSSRDANQMTTDTEQFAIAGGAAVDKAVSAMEGINQSSNKIAAIIGVIDEIAFQTNLLALNAAVEAARAGEQGRGFAVVAGEVRTLAQRSAGAAKEIKDLISDSVDRVESGSKLVNDSGTTLNEIIESVKKVSRVINDVSASAAQQYDGIQQVNTTIAQMDQMTQQNAALVEESSAASQSMSEQAEKLNGLVEFFTLNTSSAKKQATNAYSKPASNAVSQSTIRPKKEAKLTPVKNTPPKKEMPNKAVAPVSNSAAHDDGDWEEF